MESPLVRSIVDQPSVTLPFAGIEDSFTPYVGYDNVIGVKSGRTAEAGGCDVMAMTFVDGTRDAGGLRGGARPAGRRPARRRPVTRPWRSITPPSPPRRRLHLESDRSFGEFVSYGSRHVAFGLTASHALWWWPAQGAPRVRINIRTFTSRVHRGEPVGVLRVIGLTTRTFVLRAFGTLAPPTLLQRLR